MKQEEKEYIRRILGGEIELYGYFLDTYGSRIFALVQSMIPQREEAEDVTQEAFIKAYESLRNWRGDCEFLSWLYRIACNTATDVLRKSKRRKEEPLPDDEAIERLIDEESLDAFDLADDSDFDSRIEDLQLAISWLTAEERALITLFYYDNKSLDTCAYILQISESNVKVRLHRVRKKLSLYLYRIEHGNEPLS